MNKRAPKKRNWALVWLIQMAVSGLLGLLCAACHGISPLEGIAAWGLMPLSGLLLAYAATRRGLNNYLAWIAPPLLPALIWLLRWTYLPEPGPVLVAVFCAVVGAAAGEVKNQEDQRRKDRHRHGKY